MMALTSVGRDVFRAFSFIVCHGKTMNAAVGARTLFLMLSLANVKKIVSLLMKLFMRGKRPLWATVRGISLPT